MKDEMIKKNHSKNQKNNVLIESTKNLMSRSEESSNKSLKKTTRLVRLLQGLSLIHIQMCIRDRNKIECGARRELLDTYLSEFMWRTRNANHDLFEKMLDDIIRPLHTHPAEVQNIFPGDASRIIMQFLEQSGDSQTLNSLY